MHDVEAMPGRIEAWLAINVRPARVERYELLTGGFSRVMARVSVTWEDGATEVLVLRGDPPPEQATLESDRDAEWALLQSLTTADVLPVPAARWYVEDPSWFGTKALFLDHLPSTTLQAQLETTTVPRAAERLCDLMADVASVTPEQVDIAGPASWDAYIDTKLAAWRAVADDHVEALPVTRYLVAWMDTHRPPPAPFRLVHGDLQAANILVTPDDTWHLIDWEFARIGDPREDLGYYNAYSGAVPPNLLDDDLDGFLAQFRARTGLDEDTLNPATFAWFTILSTLTAVKGMFDAISGMARGERNGTPVAYNSILVTLGNRNFLDAIERLEAADMISRPTTQQLLEDCAREVRETITPLVQDPAARVRLEMLEQILASSAVRSAHEIAWMDEECAAMRAFAVEVADAHPGAEVLADAVAADRAAPAPSLHLDDRVAAYDRAGQAFCEAIDVALRSDRPDLAAKATALVRARKDREADTRPGFFFPGRR